MEKKIAATMEMAIEIFERRRPVPLAVVVSGDAMVVDELDVELEFVDLVVPAKRGKKMILHASNWYAESK
jgi:hypothetical protein